MRARLHALDTLRAFLMLLGVVYHSVQYSLIGHDLAGGAPLLEGFVFFVHTWRMPAFFLLSGFFTELLIERRGLLPAGRNRLERVALPFLFSLVTILPLNVYFVSAYVDLSHHGTDGVFNLQFLWEALYHRWRKPKLHHLWFLYYLLGFLALYFSARARPLRAALGKIRAFGRPALYALALAALAFMPTPLNVDAPDALVPRIPEFCFYFAFFALGGLAFAEYRARGELVLPPIRWAAALAAAGFAALAWIWLTGEPAAYLSPRWLAYAFLKLLSVLGSVYLVNGLFQRYGGRESAAIRFLTFASFWTYLVHEPLINVWGTLFRSYTWPPGLEILMTATLTYAVSLLSYRFLVRGTWLDGLLNGKGKAP
jgi:glucans biosynthesis protein C